MNVFQPKIAAYFSLNLTFLNNLTFDLANVEKKYIIGDIFFRIPPPISTRYMYVFNMRFPLPPPPPAPILLFKLIGLLWASLFSRETIFGRMLGIVDAVALTTLTLPLLVLQPKHKDANILGNHLLNPCHVGIHWIALAEYSQMSTHVPGFQ